MRVAPGGTVARITKWEINPSLPGVKEWADSDTAGWTARSAGRKDATIVTEGKFDITNRIYNLFETGDTLSVQLQIGALILWVFPRALCMDFKLAVNVDTEEIVGWAASWGADGPVISPII